MTDAYDPSADFWGSWALAVRCRRLDLIREGKAEPDLDDEEEVQVALEAGFQIVRAEHHRRSA